MQYARLRPNSTVVEAIIDTTPEAVAALAPNKRAWLRLFVIDPQPTPTAAQVVVDTGYLVETDKVRQTWALRTKTAAELDNDDLLAEQANINVMLTDLTAQRAVTSAIWDGYNPGQLKAEQWRDRQALLRAVSFLIRKNKIG
jgi:hypothetical protein